MNCVWPETFTNTPGHFILLIIVASKTQSVGFSIQSDPSYVFGPTTFLPFFILADLSIGLKSIWVIETTFNISCISGSITLCNLIFPSVILRFYASYIISSDNFNSPDL